LKEDERRTPDPAAERQRELDAQVEDLTRRVADIINTAGADQKQDLREYALDLLKEQTEIVEAPEAPSRGTSRSRTNPIGMALLLGAVALPLLLLFAPVGLTLLAVAAVMGLWGVVQTLIRR
jgi:hypothetical protein